VNRNRFEGDPQWSRQELDHAPLSPQLIAAMMAWQLFCIVIQHLTFSPLNSPLMLPADERKNRKIAQRFVSGVPRAALGVRAAAWCSTNSIFYNINTRSPALRADSPTERAQHCVMKIRFLPMIRPGNIS
jgi:hypothetical protein